MAYADGLQLMPNPLTSTPVEVEAAAADYMNVVAPCNLTVEEFGVLITENMVAQATDHVVKLQKKSAIGGSATDVISLTLGNSATLKRGDGVKEAQVAISADTDLTNGQVVLSINGETCHVGVTFASKSVSDLLTSL